jgi:DNA-binding transcriptional ArsR family regulator
MSRDAESREAALFAALGDETRLRLVARLSEHGPASLSRLREGAHVSRQAVTKHLRVMERSGLVHSQRHGRETIWQLDPSQISEVRAYLESISKHWDEALARLQRLIEGEADTSSGLSSR